MNKPFGRYPKKTPPAPASTKMIAKTPKQRRKQMEAERVKDLLSLNVPVPDVATRLGMGEVLLRRLYRNEIEAADLAAGPKAHQYNDQTARQVKAAAQVGLTKHQIGRVVGISPHILNEYYSEDVEIGRAHGELEVAKHTYRRATSTKDQMPQVTSAFFMLKSRHGWREAEALEISGPDGGPIQTHHAVVVLPAKTLIEG